MNHVEILNELTIIFTEVLDEGAISLSTSTTAGDVDGWDSLTHIELVMMIEKKFKIRFTASEIQRWKNVGELVDNIAVKLAA